MIEFCVQGSINPEALWRPFHSGGKPSACYESTILLSFMSRRRYTLRDMATIRAKLGHLTGHENKLQVSQLGTSARFTIPKWEMNPIFP
jgi:hypothetical protein